MTFEEDIVRAADTIRRGGIVIYPTDTVWGIGCDATNPEAVSRVFAIKHRDDSKALITLMTEAMTSEYLPGLPESSREHLRYTDRPITVICPGAHGLAPALLATDGSVGVRLTREAYSEALCREVSRPVVSTSVNISGQPAPAIFAEIEPALLRQADYVATYRRDDPTPSRPSRIVAVDSDGSVRIIRE